MSPFLKLWFGFTAAALLSTLFFGTGFDAYMWSVFGAFCMSLIAEKRQVE